MADHFPFGGRVRHFIPFWKSFCRDREVLSILNGVKVEFENNECPIQKFLPHEFKMSEEERKFVDKEIDHLLKNGFIKKLTEPLPNGWVSNIFLVPKKQGGFCMILNLKPLNKHIKHKKFKIDGIERVIQMLHKDDMLLSLDLTSAYGHLYISPEFHSLFMFTWRKQYYCYITLPQGFSDSPRLFVRWTAPIMTQLRKALVDILIYIDDTFIRASTRSQALASLHFTKEMFEKCGLTINLKKSCMVPTTQMEFLGFIIDSVEYSIAVTREKRDKLKAILLQILAKLSQKIHIKLLAKVIGIIVSFFPASNTAKLHYRKLERFKIKQLHTGSWGMHIRLNQECRSELRWWVSYLQTDIKHFLHSVDHTIEIFTDASFHGFGSSWNKQEFQGKFTEKQKTLPINTKELLAIYYTLKVYIEQLWNEVVLIRCDNVIALYCIKSYGSRDVLRNRIVAKTFHLARLYNFTLKCSYVNTKPNESDWASRVFKIKSINTEWCLHKSDFDKVLKLATTTPTVDMFTSEFNKKLPQFISWHPSKNAMHVDAFTYKWSRVNGYLFAPFHYLSNVLKKCLDDEIQHMCGVFPLWPTKTWWPTLMRLSQGKVVELKGAGQRLALPWDPEIRHPMGSRLK